MPFNDRTMRRILIVVAAMVIIGLLASLLRFAL